MNPNEPTPRVPLPDPAELATRMDALMALRQQMLELHARLEYLRLMLRVNPQAGPRR